MQDGHCLGCDSSCKICSNGNVDSCSACHDSYFLDIKSGKCLSGCVKGFYQDICDIQTGLLCCEEICGDGLLFTLQCDDKNSFNGDGCSSTCNIEPNFFCSYDYKKMVSICHYIAPLIANISLPNNSATFIRIQFNQPIINWNESLTQYIDVHISLKKANFYTYNLTFTNNKTIDIIVQYNISFKPTEFFVNFLKTSAFISDKNLTLNTKSLSIKLPNYDYYSLKTENLLKGMTQVSESSQATTSLALSFLTVTNLSPLIVCVLLSSLQMMFYLSLIRIKYPRNFINTIKGAKIFTFNSLPNYFLIYAQNNNYLKELNSIFEDNEMTSSFLIDNESIIFSLIQLIIIHGLLLIIVHVTGYESMAIINKNSYYQNMLAKSGYILLVCLLSIVHFDYTNWLQGLSAAISYCILIFLIIWIVGNITKFEEMQENLDNNFPLFPTYLLRFQIFGLIDLLKEIIFALSLIIFEYYPMVNILIFLTTQILYIILLIKFKPTENSKIFLFSKFGNLIILLICSIWAIDDKANFLKEDDRNIIGWLGISLIGLVFVVNLLSSTIATIGVNKVKVKKLLGKCKRKKNYSK